MAGRVLGPDTISRCLVRRVIRRICMRVVRFSRYDEERLAGDAGALLGEGVDVGALGAAVEIPPGFPSGGAQEDFGEPVHGGKASRSRARLRFLSCGVNADRIAIKKRCASDFCLRGGGSRR